jgi:crotonobetainyl-CoA:carnitine CoA-transferase CaiB-like acyl-CoA transferase
MTDRRPAWPIYDIFETSDGRLFVGVVTDTQWAIFCDAFGLPDLASDPTLTGSATRVAARDRTIPRVSEVLKQYTTQDLADRCEKLGLPFAPITRPIELFDDPHLNAAGGLVPVTLPDGRPSKLPALPIAIDGERPGLTRDIPSIGEQSDEIAREIGYSDAEIAALRTTKAIG